MNTTNWIIDTSHSGITFSVRHMMFAKVRGRFGRFQGTIAVPQSDLGQAHVEVEIDASSIDTGVDARDQHLRSPDFFDVARFPSLRFTSKRVEPLGGERYHLVGDLTIRDVTREVVLEAEALGQGKDPWGNARAAFAAKTSIDRTVFGLKWNQALETGGVLVGERIDIELEVQAVAATASQAA
jgi:polyisoprenoid-binding protein YceI